MKNLIKVERARHSLSQTDLAEKCGVTRQTIYAIEKGKFTPSVILAFKISRILSISIEDLFIMEDKDFRI
ncbi:transcriptional regulator [Marivirga tractuosa]|uniref:Transcriptional regulator, XRE family n=1 Tax=Marivirga tractuosa (strain ATCC 23168 / DSM 4126 / NBRC 15989 / NCIMB 1408 / VKM B-1430 / H-43) TaxID=643867 RepID=E4TR86_MARTH|nr:helix-turn-helix transcriptional regulator [Marivirga tractuosa]ADR23738.1 transcriptional regulator, XRE family [Marivirga tractuosa DSM 4126]BDD15581.1 transcriptional regulator [Marivirga tractuosa]